MFDEVETLTKHFSCNIISYMRCDTKLSSVLHILHHLAAQTSPITSAKLSQMLSTNAVVIRRIMSGLRQQGYVQSEKGHGGGWTLSCELSQVTLRDIYVALGSPSLLAIGNRTESPDCLVEQAVNAALQQTFDDAEELLLSRFDEITLSSLSADYRTRSIARDNSSTCSGASKCP